MMMTMPPVLATPTLCLVNGWKEETLVICLGPPAAVMIWKSSSGKPHLHLHDLWTFHVPFTKSTIWIFRLPVSWNSALLYLCILLFLLPISPALDTNAQCQTQWLCILAFILPLRRWHHAGADLRSELVIKAATTAHWLLSRIDGWKGQNDVKHTHTHNQTEYSAKDNIKKLSPIE